VVGSTAEDGDPIDVVVLGPRLPRGHLGTYSVVGAVLFVDAGCRDDKWICGGHSLRIVDKTVLFAFFSVFALFKKVVNTVQFRAGPTSFRGVMRCAAPEPSAGRSGGVG